MGDEEGKEGSEGVKEGETTCSEFFMREAETKVTIGAPRRKKSEMSKGQNWFGRKEGKKERKESRE